MELLLDAADTLLAAHPEEPPRPDFVIPEECQQAAEDLMECKDSSKGGRGWFARKDIQAGTVLLVEKPLAMVMDWQDDEEDDDFPDHDDEEEHMEDEDEASGGGSKLNDLLLLELLKAIQENPSLWTDKLAHLHPRDNETAASFPAWICHVDALFIDIEAKIQELESLKSLPVKDISKRLPLVVRYNVLSIETCPELLIHPGPDGHVALSGTGIYHFASYFNHDAKPNASRWTVGDVMWFVTNQDVAAGEEVCISYLEHDVLCESPLMRTIMLDMDFKDGDFVDDEEGENGPLLPVVDSQVQNELMAMDPFERLSTIQELMDQATGEGLPEDEAVEQGEDDMDVSGEGWFKCDAHNLRIIKAVTLDGMGQSEQALQVWQECVAFTEEMLPPNDESSVVMRVQAALCAQHAGKQEEARVHAAAALKAHNIIFGGEVARFRRRYQRELQLSLRPDADMSGDADILWPIPE